MQVIQVANAAKDPRSFAVIVVVWPLIPWPYLQGLSQ